MSGPGTGVGTRGEGAARSEERGGGERGQRGGGIPLRFPPKPRAPPRASAGARAPARPGPAQPQPAPTRPTRPPARASAPRPEAESRRRPRALPDRKAARLTLTQATARPTANPVFKKETERKKKKRDRAQGLSGRPPWPRPSPKDSAAL